MRVLLQSRHSRIDKNQKRAEVRRPSRECILVLCLLSEVVAVHETVGLKLGSPPPGIVDLYVVPAPPPRVRHEHQRGALKGFHVVVYMLPPDVLKEFNRPRHVEGLVRHHGFGAVVVLSDAVTGQQRTLYCIFRSLHTQDINPTVQHPSCRNTPSTAHVQEGVNIQHLQHPRPHRGRLALGVVRSEPSQVRHVTFTPIKITVPCPAPSAGPAQRFRSKLVSAFFARRFFARQQRPHRRDRALLFQPALDCDVLSGDTEAEFLVPKTQLLVAEKQFAVLHSQLTKSGVMGVQNNGPHEHRHRSNDPIQTHCPPPPMPLLGRKKVQ
eukprot:Hpha_TRINITY_DN16824_c0_g6::TRINITY_DN16824_c0_g6_i1::g.150141::m.150141